jgi:hypothetical protein
MPPSKVIRIDDQVWSELQKRARPLEDTPNSVLRRVLGLPEEALEEGGVDPRVQDLLDRLAERLGAPPQMSRERRNYAVLSPAREVVAYIRPQQQKLRLAAGQEAAREAGLSHWDRERPDGFPGGPSVRWYIPDGDEVAYRQGETILEKLWRSASKQL